MHFVFTNFAKKKFLKLDASVQKNIVKKLKVYKTLNFEDVPFKKIRGDFSGVSHRLRIGKYRVLINVLSYSKILVVDIGHRKNIYK